jgi:hypothetical protein
MQNACCLRGRPRYYYAGAADAFFLTLIPDSEGNLIMGFEFSSTRLGVDPSQVYVGRPPRTQRL